MQIINALGIYNYRDYKYNDSDCRKSLCHPSFGYRLPKIAVNDVRNMHNLNCGCCGNPMLTTEELKHFLNSFTAGSKRALEHSSIVAKYKDSEAYEFLKHLSSIDPKKTIRALISIPENRIKIRTLDQKTQLDINYIALLSDGITVKAPRAIQKLSKYYEYFSKDARETLDLMEIYSIKYPKKTFSEIFQLPEVFEAHNSINETFKQQLNIQKTDCFKILRSVCAGLPKSDVKGLQDTNTEAIKILNNPFYLPHIKKSMVEEVYNKFLEEHPQDRKIKRQIKSVISNFPYKTNLPDSFIVSSIQERKSDLDIIKRFTDELQLTFEHVLPKSKNGGDNIGNGIFLCKKCNSERSDVPYPIFLRFHPEMKANLQKQLNKIMTFIKHRKLLNYDTYPLEIKQTVWDNTDHIIKLKINEFLMYRQQQAAKKLKIVQARHDENEKRCKVATKNLEEIDAKIQEAMAVIKKLKKERNGIREEHEKASNLKLLSQAEVKRSEEDYILAKHISEYDKGMNKNTRAKRIKKIKE